MSSSPEWADLQSHAREIQASFSLPTALKDADRCAKRVVRFDGSVFDYARTWTTDETLDKLYALSEKVGLVNQISRLTKGLDENPLNFTEKRAVLHMALRAAKGSSHFPPEAVSDVHEVLDRIYKFSEDVRLGKWKGVTRKALKNVVSIGIGGSYLGPEFVYEAMRQEPELHEAAKDRTLRFLANVDPVDVARALEGLDPAETLVIIVSKTFTTAETMLNARTVRQWLIRRLVTKQRDAASIIKQHMVAVSADVPKCVEFGIQAENVFGFWDWVGGRYSVCSAVGALPLSLHFGPKAFESFLTGAREMDEHFLTAPPRENLPIVMGLLALWNHTFLEFPCRAILPYSQALLRFASHIQQVSMESNGKRVTSPSGEAVSYGTGEIIFGEPGTNGQHSFYQLIHQGRVVPCDFIGVVRSQQPTINGDLDQTGVSNHDELMSNFFAQPDALAMGKTPEVLRAEGVKEELIPHKTFTGNRPSTSLLLPYLDARRIGQLLSLYENQVAVQGFMLGINSFDQWGVELGKVLAGQVRNEIAKHRSELGAAASSASSPPRKRVKLADTSFNPSTSALLEEYLGTR